MDLLRELGPLALGSRLRRLSDRVMGEVSRIYSAEQVDFEPRWFPLFTFVCERGPASIGAAAEAIGQTQPAISVFARELAAEGLITVLPDPTDERRRLLHATPKGQAARRRLQPLWGALRAAVAQALSDSGLNLLEGLEALEREMDRNSLESRTRDAREKQRRVTPTVVDYRPELREHFKRLNLEWIETLFRVEDSDHALLDDPERSIIAIGGAVFFAELDGEIVGTCGLLPEGTGEFEFIKLAVSRAARGRGVAQLLLKAALQRAGQLGGRRVTLHSHHSLQDALHIYEKFGFRHYEPEHPTSLQRTDIHMEIDLAPIGNPQTA